MNNPYQECISAMYEQWRGERPNHKLYTNTISTCPSQLTSGFCTQIAAMPKKVIFNNPATIVYWVDGSKTVVKCGPDDEFDPEKGLAMAICKYAFGNDNAFHKVFKKWMPKEETVKQNVTNTVNISLNNTKKLGTDVERAVNNFADAIKKMFK